MAVIQTQTTLVVEIGLVLLEAMLEMVQEQGKVHPLQLHLVWKEHLARSS